MSSSSNEGCGCGCLSMIGLGLGLMFWGPIGGIVAYVLARLIESAGSSDDTSDKQRMRQNLGNTGSQRDFNISLLILSAAVMKADNVLLRSELDYVKRFYVRNFGTQRAESYIKMLREILQKDYDLEKVTSQVRYIDYASRLQLLYYLFGIAEADGDINDNELQVLTRIAVGLNITTGDFESVRAMFNGAYNNGYQQGQGSGWQSQNTNIDNAYKILEISSDATDEEVKKAYREMAKKHHPDRVSHLGEEVRKSAEEKLQEINNAYEVIKKQRNIV